MIHIGSDDIRRLGGFLPVPRFVARDRNLSYGAKMLYGQLLSMGWQNGECEPSQELLGYELGDIEERQVRRYLDELKESGYLETTRRGLGKTNTYTLLVPTSEDKMSAPVRKHVSAPVREQVSAPVRKHVSAPSLEVKNTDKTEDSEEIFSSSNPVLSEDPTQGAQTPNQHANRNLSPRTGQPQTDSEAACVRCPATCGPRCTCCCHGLGLDTKPAKKEKTKPRFRQRNQGGGGNGSTAGGGIGKTSILAVVPPWFAKFADALKRYHAGTLYPQYAIPQLTTSVDVMGEDAALAAWVYCLETTIDPTKALFHFVSAPRSFSPPTGWKPSWKHNPKRRETERGNGRGITEADRAAVIAKVRAERAAEEAARAAEARKLAEARKNKRPIDYAQMR